MLIKMFLYNDLWTTWNFWPKTNKFGDTKGNRWSTEKNKLGIELTEYKEQSSKISPTPEYSYISAFSCSKLAVDYIGLELVWYQNISCRHNNTIYFKIEMHVEETLAITWDQWLAESMYVFLIINIWLDHNRYNTAKTWRIMISKNI